MKSKTIIAIDPDMRESGVAVINRDGEVLDLKKMSVSVLTKFISMNKDSVFAIEDVNKHGSIYQSNRKGCRAVQARIAQNVGMVKAAGSMIAEIIEDAAGGPPILAPLGIGKQVKRNAKLFNELTGWQGKSNEDTRDAACIGRWVASRLRDGWVVDGESGQLVRPVSQ